jgi:hypothetical protein
MRQRATLFTGRGGIFALVAAVALGLAGTVNPVDAAALKNYTIFFYQPGIAVTGTLRGGQFTQAFTYPMNAIWTNGVADRTSLLLYNSNTGAAQAGTLFDSSYTKKHSYTLPTGYLITASCDTVMMYKPGSGKVLTMTLINGVLGTRHTSSVPNSNPYESLDASCSTFALFQQVTGANPAAYRAGHLAGGLASTTGSSNIPDEQLQIAAMTDDSFLLYGVNGLYGVGGTIGTAKAGVLKETKRYGALGNLDIVAASPDTLLMYNKTTGLGSFATLVNGVYTYKGSSGFSPGWVVIAAGK